MLSHIFILMLISTCISCQTYTLNDLTKCGQSTHITSRILKIVNGAPASAGNWPWQVCS